MERDQRTCTWHRQDEKLKDSGRTEHESTHAHEIAHARLIKLLPATTTSMKQRAADMCVVDKQTRNSERNQQSTRDSAESDRTKNQHTMPRRGEEVEILGMQIVHMITRPEPTGQQRMARVRPRLNLPVETRIAAQKSVRGCGSKAK